MALPDAELAAAKLRSSGLDPKKLKAYGYEVLSAEATRKLSPRNNVPTLKLNYFTAEGVQRKDIWRLRKLGEAKGAFGAVDKQRYVQKTGTPPAAFFPKSFAWKATLADKSSICFTEGEFKAEKACDMGFATIGLGGVWSWRSKSLGWDILPELEAINWLGRETPIVFDSDARIKPEVATAISKLAETLRRLGAKPVIVTLPDVYTDGRKTGLDDYFLMREREHGRDGAAMDFETLLDRSGRDRMAAALWNYNGRYALVAHPPVVVNEELGLRHNPATWATTINGNDFATVEKQTVAGDVRLVQEPVAEAWIKWPQRRTLNELTYEPGAPSVIDGKWNEWRGWGVEPVKGDVRPWLRLFEHLFGDDKAAMTWFMRWCLYPVKFPGAKLLTSSILWSTNQGIGKSQVGEVLGKIYGKNYISIAQSDLEADFNFWQARRQYVMVDDVSAYANKAKAGKLKKTITQKVVIINEKNIPQYELRDCLNYYLTSNNANCLYLDEHDRRFFVHQSHAVNPGKAYWDDFFKWSENGGPGHLFHYAQHEFDFGDFDPNVPAPMTEAKGDMTQHARSDVEQWLADLREHPDDRLRLGRQPFKRDIYTPQEIAALYEAQNAGSKVTPNAMGIALQQMFPKAAGVSRIRVGERAERLYAIRNREQWESSSVKQCADHVNKGRAIEQGDAKGAKF